MHAKNPTGEIPGNPLVENGTLEDDQNRRDFTINALAISLNPESFGELLDPFGGLKHLEEKIITTPLDPGSTFSDDPLRMLRGIRFATRLGSRSILDTLEAMSRSQGADPDCLPGTYYPRSSIRSCESGQPGKGFLLLDQTGLLEIIFPELYRMKGVEEVDGQFHKDNFLHTLKVLDNIAQKTR